MKNAARLLVVAALSLLSASLKAEGLSWTDPNKDTACKGGWVCSQAFISQSEITVMKMKIYSLRIMVALYVNVEDGDSAETVNKRIADAKNVSMRIVVETSDHLKRNFSREKIPIEIYHKEGSVIEIRHCEAEFQLLDTGVISVLGVDADEVNSKADVLTHHVFR